MSKPYETENYDTEEDTKEYIDLYARFLGDSNNLISTVEYNPITITIGDTSYISSSSTNSGIFNQIIKSSSMSYSSGIITINKSGNYHLTFKGIIYAILSLGSITAPIFFIKKNGNTIAKYYIQPKRFIGSDGGVGTLGSLFQEINFISPIFRASIGDEIRIDMTLVDSTQTMVNHNVFIKEI
jgi:hypothetical protein